jgi:FMN-binding domain
MKRISYWFLSTLSALVLLFGYHTSTSGAQAAGSPSAIVSTGTPGGSSSSGSSGSSTSTTLTGGVASTEWGPVQVQLTMSGDTITKVTVLQQPSGNGKDAEINSYALPILISETEQAGTAQIAMVSGATVTSTGYIQSLQSALDQA